MAKKLAQALAPFDTYWHEDPFRLDNIADLRSYAPHSKAWVCASETLATTHAFREYLETGAAGMERNTDIPIQIVDVVQACIILMVAIRLTLGRAIGRRLGSG